MTPRALLLTLLDATRLGQISQHDAAELLAMRKSEFAEMVRARPVEAAVWRIYVHTFHNAFPETDSRCARRETRPALLPDELWRPGKAAPVMVYGMEEVEALPPAQPHLKLAEPKFDDS